MTSPPSFPDTLVTQLTASRSVVQRVHVVSGQDARWEAFKALIKPFDVGGAQAHKRVIVFANTKVLVKQVEQYIKNK